MKLTLDEETADEIFEIFQELIYRAKENGDTSVLLYVGPINLKYCRALIEAKGQKKKKYTLPKVKNLSQ